MWLLETKTITLHEFNGDSIPSYAILSHTWGQQEVSHEMISRPEAIKLAGYSKIAACCRLAAAQGLHYAWIDTCCIDKKSSAELSEAINSMWRWYEKSAVCYAYIQDCEIASCRDPEHLRDKFRNSRWFTRGWTLQELLAPTKLVFYDTEWNEIGDRKGMTADIHHATGIDDEHQQHPRDASCAIKMSWMSKRQTTRVEDLAYSLLGLFDVYMPLIYGEGANAFLRLQHEIVKTSNDETIFAWTDESLCMSGMFALSPKAFAGSGDIVMYRDRRIRRQPYSITNFGLAIEILRSGSETEKRSPALRTQLQVPIVCRRRSEDDPLSISLSLDETGKGAVRYDLHSLLPFQKPLDEVDVGETVYIKPIYRQFAPRRRVPGLEVRWNDAFKYHLSYAGLVPSLIVPDCEVSERTDQQAIFIYGSTEAPVVCRFTESTASRLQSNQKRNGGALREFILLLQIDPTGWVIDCRLKAFVNDELDHVLQSPKAWEDVMRADRSQSGSEEMILSYSSASSTYELSAYQ
ncbi:MAG: hypothetical protein Q9212_002356 [Teloschistes hypoglaucus]